VKRSSQGSSGSKRQIRLHPEGEEEHISYSQGSNSSSKKKMKITENNKEIATISPVILPDDLI